MRMANVYEALNKLDDARKYYLKLLSLPKETLKMQDVTEIEAKVSKLSILGTTDQKKETLIHGTEEAEEVFNLIKDS